MGAETSKRFRLKLILSVSNFSCFLLALTKVLLWIFDFFFF